MFEQSKTEMSSGKRNTPSRKEISNFQMGTFDSEKSREAAEARKRELRERIGNDGAAIMQGSNDRVNGLEYNNPYEEGTDKYNSYAYGYNEHGQRRLDAMNKPKTR